MRWPPDSAAGWHWLQAHMARLARFADGLGPLAARYVLRKGDVLALGKRLSTLTSRSCRLALLPICPRGFFSRRIQRGGGLPIQRATRQHSRFAAGIPQSCPRWLKKAGRDCVGPSSLPLTALPSSLHCSRAPGEAQLDGPMPKRPEPGLDRAHSSWR